MSTNDDDDDDEGTIIDVQEETELILLDFPELANQKSLIKDDPNSAITFFLEEDGNIINKDGKSKIEIKCSPDCKISFTGKEVKPNGTIMFFGKDGDKDTEMFGTTKRVIQYTIDHSDEEDQ